MGSEWRKVRLGDACEKIGSGATPRGGNESYKASGISLVRSQNIYNEGFKRDGLAFIDERQAAELENVTLKSGDVLLNITGDSVARCCQVPDDVLPARVNQHVAIIRPKAESLDTRYLRYFLVSPSMQGQMLAFASAGATRNALTKGMIESFEIPAPPLTEQRAIAAILGALDDKIELNRRMNRTLESMAQALFKQWFVEGAEAGWKKRPLSEICKAIFSGGTPSTTNSQFWGGDIPWLSSGETGDTFIIETSKKITQSAVENSSTRFARSGSTVIASAGQGKTRGQTSLLMLDTYVNQSVVVLSANNQIGSDLFLFFDLSRRYEEFRQLSDSHSSRGSLTTKTLGSLRVQVPPRALIETFDKTVAPMVGKIRQNQEQSRTLAALRDALLPKLISGELRVAPQGAGTKPKEIGRSPSEEASAQAYRRHLRPNDRYRRG